MTSKRILELSFLLLLILWTPSITAQSQHLERPTRPERFHSVDEVEKYVKDMREFIRTHSLRYGKRFAPDPLVTNAQKAVKVAEDVNEANKARLELLDRRNKMDMEENNPNEIYGIPRIPTLNRGMDDTYLHSFYAPPFNLMQILRAKAEKQEGDLDLNDGSLIKFN